jgi:hypothetical protein
MDIIVLLILFTLAISWTVWALTYMVINMGHEMSTSMHIFVSLGLSLGGVLAGSFGSQLVKAILALT